MSLKNINAYPLDSAARTPEVSTLTEVRVSCASSVRIQDDQGRLMLLLNKNRAKQGEHVFLPVGGGIEATDQGLTVLNAIPGVDSSSFEKGADLRFASSGNAVNSIREWFLNRIDRETDPLRELSEELTEEQPLVNPTDLTGVTGELAGYGTELAETKREGQRGRPTLRMFEVFDAKLPAVAMEKLALAATQPNSLVYFATPEEILQGVTNDGAEIPTAALVQLSPQPTLESFQ